MYIKDKITILKNYKIWKYKIIILGEDNFKIKTKIKKITNDFLIKYVNKAINFNFS